MMSSAPRTLLVVLLSLAPGGPLAMAQQVRVEALPVSAPRLLAVTTDDGSVGAVVELLGGSGPALDVLAPTDGARLLRRFGQQLFVVNRFAGTLRRVPLNGGASRVYDLGAGSEPMDVLVPGGPVAAPDVAWVTRRDDPWLYQLDLVSGSGTDAIDLSPVGGGAAIALGTMLRAGTRLFVQVRVPEAAGTDVPGGDTGVLAVVDLVRGELLDVDTTRPGIQGIALAGAPPRFKMQVVDGTLYVSTTDSFHDVRGGIERVDLATLTSIGYAVSEANGHSDMGGFVMLDAERGYYVFHTDLLASTHLVPFTVAGGPEPGPALIDLLGDTVDNLVYDPDLRRLYLPSGFASNGPGLYVFDTDTNEQLAPPLSTGLRPHDALLIHALVPFGPPH